MFRLLILCALVGAPFAAQARKVKIKMATLAPKGSVYHRIMKDMGQAWKEASDGKIKFKLYAGGVAGDDKDVIRKIRLGTIHGGLLTSGGVSAVDNAIHALVIPMAFKSNTELEHVLGAIRDDMDAVYAAKGFVMLDYIFGGWVRFFNKNGKCTTADLKSQKLFVWAGSPAESLWKNAGFNPVPLPSTEISTALQTGLVTALPTTPQAALLMQWQKHAPFMCSPIWAPMVGAITIKKSTWEALDPDLRTKFKAAALEAGAKLRAEAIPNDIASIKAMKERGLTIVDVTGADAEAWNKQAQDSWKVVRGTFAPEVFFDKAIAARDAYRAQGGK